MPPPRTNALADDAGRIHHTLAGPSHGDRWKGRARLVRAESRGQAVVRRGVFDSRTSLAALRRSKAWQPSDVLECR